MIYRLREVFDSNDDVIRDFEIEQIQILNNFIFDIKIFWN